MTFGRTLRRTAVVCSALLLIAGVAAPGFAEDVHKPSAGTAKSGRRHARTHVAAQESAAARDERERREDLERRVERLEQLYEMRQPTMPPAGPADARPQR